MATNRGRRRELQRIAQVAAVVIPLGITASLAARSISTVELTNRSTAIKIPESTELLASGTALIVVAASARKVLQRRIRS